MANFVQVHIDFGVVAITETHQTFHISSYPYKGGFVKVLLKGCDNITFIAKSGVLFMPETCLKVIKYGLIWAQIQVRCSKTVTLDKNG